MSDIEDDMVEEINRLNNVIKAMKAMLLAGTIPEKLLNKIMTDAYNEKI